MKEIEISTERSSTGDIGPCAHVECTDRATWIINFLARGVCVVAWVCDDHRKTLERVR